MKKMPVLFVGHGSPMNVLDKENPFNQNFSLITQNFPKPKAILMISAHWYSSRLQPAQWHFNLAKKLSVLREQGVLIIGSGNIVHNLRAISWEHIDQIGAGYDWAYAFRDHINRAMTTQNNEELVHYEQFGEGAALSVPTPDHYLPLLYVMALREPDENVAFFNDHLIAGSLSMTSVLVGLK